MDHDLLKPVSYVCPWCWELVDSTIDLSVGTQSYIEDCTVCCNPIEISFMVRGSEILNLRAERVT